MWCSTEAYAAYHSIRLRNHTGMYIYYSQTVLFNMLLSIIYWIKEANTNIEIEPGIYGDVNCPCPRTTPLHSVGLLPYN